MNKIQQKRTDGAPIRVLVLDDEESIRRVVKHGLSEYGCDVKTASNGRQGLQMLLTHMFDVMVVDLRMQEMDGIAFIQEAKKIWPWQRFVIYSGFVDERFAQLAKEQGIETVLEKPLDMGDLLKAIEHEAKQNDKPEQPSGNQLPRQLISHQLNIMRHISSDVLQSQNLLNGLIQLGQAINDMLPFHVMGILAADGEKLLLLQSADAQPESAFEHIQQYSIERYQALSGQLLDLSEFRIERSGPDALTTNNRKIKSITSVPVIAGDTVEGILTLGSFEPDAFDDINVALLYQAASSLSTLSTALREMRQMATRDPLTGLYNRRQLDEELDRSWRLSLRYNHPMAILMLDMDGLKQINDQWGHSAGDGAIREFAEMLIRATRSTDILARYGGDEFTILLPQAGQIEASALSDRILDIIRSSTVTVSGKEVKLTASIGISTFEAGDNINNPEELIAHADQALYRAKNGGRNQSIIWTDRLFRPEDVDDDSSGDDRKPRKGKVLILDDEEYVITLLRRILEQDSYEVVCVRTIAEAYDELKVRGRSYDILLCDLSLPDGDGMEVVRWARETDYDIVNIIITGNVTADNVIEALRHGVYDFIQKPITADSLTALLNRALQYRNLLRENARYRAYLEEMVRAKKSELSKALDDIKNSYEFTLETMVAMLDAREFETGQHSVRVRELTLSLAQKMGIEGEQLEEIGRGALLHDIGKVGIPDAILLKPGKLTEDEWEVMRRHPEIGYRFVKKSEFLQTAAGVVLSHHERWDGSGYPHGLKEKDINIGARIFAVIDAYDAMRSSRVYKNSMSAEEAQAEVENEAGRQFDPEVVQAFMSCVDEMENIGRWSQSFS